MRCATATFGSDERLEYRLLPRTRIRTESVAASYFSRLRKGFDGRDQMKKARKGARRRTEIPAATLLKLNRGDLETANLVEFLALDFAKLMKSAVPGIENSGLKSMRAARAAGVTTRMALAGQIIHGSLGMEGFEAMASSPSDTVRSWAPYVLAQEAGLSLKQRVARSKALADDGHFGVREWTWMALRPFLIENLQQALKLLIPWTKRRSCNLRRFAVEALRPRGVWCPHIRALREDPSLAIDLLEPVRSDPERYVQDSCANWLNDAAKDHPDWVRGIVQRWRSESPTDATAYISRRALRSLR